MVAVPASSPVYCDERQKRTAVKQHSACHMAAKRKLPIGAPGQPEQPIRLQGERQGDIYVLQKRLRCSSHDSTYTAVRLPRGRDTRNDVDTASAPASSTGGALASGEQVTIRFIRLRASPTLLQRVKAEVGSINQLTQPHIARLRDVVTIQDFSQGFSQKTPAQRSAPAPAIGLVMDPARCTLESYLLRCRQLPEGAARWWFQQLVLAVDHCHDKDIQLGEIQPAGILIQTAGKHNQILKLAALGRTSRSQLPASNLPQGFKSVYTAPEALQPGEAADDIESPSQAATVWSCGVVLLHMLFPLYFTAIVLSPCLPTALSEKLGLTRTRATFSDWVYALLHHPDAASRSEECRDLLTKMLEVDPAKRASMKEVMAHPWFRTSLPPGATELNKQALHEQPSISPQALDAWMEGTFKRLLGADVLSMAAADLAKPVHSTMAMDLTFPAADGVQVQLGS